MHNHVCLVVVTFRQHQGEDFFVFFFGCFFGLIEEGLDHPHFCRLSKKDD